VKARLTETPTSVAFRQAVRRSIAILVDVLGLEPDEVDEFDNETGLFGHLPELDSMAVAGLFTEIEDRFDMLIEDDDVDAEMLETYGGLLAFVEMKRIEG
jgi:acyl carrier protein